MGERDLGSTYMPKSQLYKPDHRVSTSLFIGLKLLKDQYDLLLTTTVVFFAQNRESEMERNKDRGEEKKRER